MRTFPKTGLTFLLLGTLALTSCSVTGGISIKKRYKTSKSAWAQTGGGPNQDNHREIIIGSNIEMMWQKSVSSAIGNSISVVDSIIYFSTLNGYVYAMNLSNGRTAGRLKFYNPSVSGTAHDGSDMYFSLAYGKETLIAYDLSNRKYKFRRGLGPIENTPAVWEDFVYVGTQKNTFYCIQRVDGAEKWVFKTPKPVHTGAAISGNLVFFGCDDGNVYALNRYTGKKSWTFKTGRAVVATPAVDKTTVYVGSTDGYFYAIELETGRLKWSYHLPSGLNGAIYAQASLSKDHVYFGSTDGHLYALNKAIGELRWKFKTGGAISNACISTESEVLVGSQDKFLYLVNSTTGEKIWSFELKGRIQTSPALYGNYIVAASEAKHIYLFKF